MNKDLTQNIYKLVWLKEVPAGQQKEQVISTLGDYWEVADFADFINKHGQAYEIWQLLPSEPVPGQPTLRTMKWQLQWEGGAIIAEKW